MTGGRYLTPEMIGATLLVYWGAMIANPYNDTFANTNSLIYRPMLSVVSYESFWGVIYLLCGALAFLMIRRGKFAKAAFICFLGLLSLGMLFLIGDYKSHAFGIYLIPAIFNFVRWSAFQWKTTRS